MKENIKDIGVRWKDISLDNMITCKVLNIFWYIGFFIGAGFGIVKTLTLLFEGEILAMFSTILVFVVGLFLFRLWLEFLYVVFKIEQNTRRK